MSDLRIYLKSFEQCTFIKRIYETVLIPPVATGPLDGVGECSSYHFI